MTADHSYGTCLLRRPRPSCRHEASGGAMRCRDHAAPWRRSVGGYRAPPPPCSVTTGHCGLQRTGQTRRTPMLRAHEPALQFSLAAGVGARACTPVSRSLWGGYEGRIAARVRPSPGFVWTARQAAAGMCGSAARPWLRPAPVALCAQSGLWLYRGTIADSRIHVCAHHLTSSDSSRRTDSPLWGWQGGSRAAGPPGLQGVHRGASQCCRSRALPLGRLVGRTHTHIDIRDRHT